MDGETRNNLRELREARGIKQSDLAKVLKCNIQTISRYENGKRDPSLAMSIRIARYFHLNVETIFSLEEDGQDGGSEWNT